MLLTWRQIWSENKDSRQNQAERSLAAHVLRIGLQELLIVLCGAVARAAAATGAMPGGFTIRLRDALLDPTPGKLLDFLMWSSSAASSLLPPRLGRLLGEEQKQGWLRKLAQLRNRWVHPKEQTPDEVLAETSDALNATPYLFGQTGIDVTSAGRAVWGEESEQLPLEPFVYYVEGRLCVLRELTRPSEPLFVSGKGAWRDEFRRFWFDLRALDPALAEPTAQEFCERLRRWTRPHAGTAPWWLRHVPRPGPGAFLVAPGLASEALYTLRSVWREALSLDSSVEPGVSAAQAIAECLGLALAPAAKELVRLLEPGQPVVLAFRTGALPSLEFARLLYWLADLRQAGSPESLRILIERDAQQLETDCQKLMDRLPEPLDELLRRPPRSRGAVLGDYLWTATKPGLLGWF